MRLLSKRIHQSCYPLTIWIVLEFTLPISTISLFINVRDWRLQSKERESISLFIIMLIYPVCWRLSFISSIASLVIRPQTNSRSFCSMQTSPKLDQKQEACWKRSRDHANLAKPTLRSRVDWNIRYVKTKILTIPSMLIYFTLVISQCFTWWVGQQIARALSGSKICKMRLSGKLSACAW